MISLSGTFYIDLTENEIRHAAGDYAQAVQNAVGLTGMTVTDVQDDNDGTSLDDRS